MSLASVVTRANTGLNTSLVKVEVHLNNGLPGLHLVGLPETSVREAKERVRSAICNSGFRFPQKRITVNLAPADVPKQGGRFDLAIAIAILLASEQIESLVSTRFELIGELALGGNLRACKALLPVILAAQKRDALLVMPAANAADNALVQAPKVALARNLCEVVECLTGQTQLPAQLPTSNTDSAVPELPCLSQVVGQAQAKQALMIAAAGGHNLLMLGSPGTGKTLLANCFRGLLPPVGNQDALVNAALHSIAGVEKASDQLHQAAFRSPHHSCSSAALIGGGTNPLPGEISLAHAGVLFLDELPEFARNALESLREPLESGQVYISRAQRKQVFPARFQLIAAMNPSPCGSANGQARSSPEQIRRYLSKLSGPLIDRFDLSVEVPNLPKGTLVNGLKAKEQMTSAQAASLIVRCRAVQRERAGVLNHQLSSSQLLESSGFAEKDLLYLEEVMTRLNLSVRAFYRLLRVARTIADLAGSTQVERSHIAQALGYRAIDKLLAQLG
ncbi:YifB family Mg chelatase-like AAA ATPase [Paraferrimonas sedimenticola]|uniref:ATP-dependent protease n=1 Tax=Paraferrimonas sedimenticola TaxID=375674 RepID=A0AA37W0R2_9GAMM|nr:YifB family Mg chelatase-like AAA ATPase [Paraferrimonas sedimenticola]GLP95367.1 ATP-dependent protease [Paraferrimonas sedimenticola]